MSSFSFQMPRSGMTSSPIDFISMLPASGGASAASNQFFPTMPSLPNPGSVPQQNSSFSPNSFPFNPMGGPGMTGIGKGMFSVNPLDPSLTSDLFGFLQSQIGQGVSPFNLSAFLPSTGGSTQPGQLSAPLNPLMQSLQSLFGPGGSIGNMASQGVNATPTWQTMVDAMQRQIGEGATNLREQFNFAGNLASSPFGTAMTDYQTQSNKDLNSLLGNMQFQGIQDQLQAGGMAGNFGQMMQGLDQASIDRLAQEFIRTSPQYNPLLGMDFGAATTFPPTLQPKQGMGGLGAILSGAGGAAGGIAALLPALTALCWVAEVIYGKDDERTELVRKWIKRDFSQTPDGIKAVIAYAIHGQAVAALASRSKELRDAIRPWFDLALARAKEIYA